MNPVVAIPTPDEVAKLAADVADRNNELEAVVTAIGDARSPKSTVSIEDFAALGNKFTQAKLARSRAEAALVNANSLVKNAGRMRASVLAHDAIKAFLAESPEVLDAFDQGCTSLIVTRAEGAYQVNVNTGLGAVRAPRATGNGGGRPRKMYHVVGNGVSVDVGSAALLEQFGGEKGQEALAKAKTGMTTKKGLHVPYGFQPDVKACITRMQAAGYTVTDVTPAAAG